MSHYLHHVPGRLRLKTAVLRRNERAAEQARQYLDGIHGIDSVEVNTLTGSLLIRYDHAKLAGPTLLNSLRGIGYLHPHHDIPRHVAAPSPRPDMVQKISDTVVNKLVDVVVERSAAALIAAII